MRREIIAVALLLLVYPAGVGAGTYYVDDNGAADWADCEHDGGTPGVKSGAAACPLATANTNVAAGDTVYLRGGTYTLSINGYHGAIEPGVTGSSEAKISYLAYGSEDPILVNAEGYGWPTYRLGVNVDSKDYIIISGIIFEDWDYF